MRKSFKQKYSLADRLRVSQEMLLKYPHRVPVICEPSQNVSPNIDISSYNKTKYLIPKDVSVGKFIMEIRKQLELNPEQALFVFVNDTLPPIAYLMGELYDKHKDEDGFLYMQFTGENTFG